MQVASVSQRGINKGVIISAPIALQVRDVDDHGPGVDPALATAHAEQGAAVRWPAVVQIDDVRLPAVVIGDACGHAGPE
jgi:hypothetical protein